MPGAEVLIITGDSGPGGREVALGQAMEASPEVDSERVVFAAKLQDGLGQLGNSATRPFVVIGPEAPLVAGMADDLRRDGYTVFGASKHAARYEANKYQATAMMKASGIPHPETLSITKQNKKWAHNYVRDADPSTYVVKANGLAAGKGVILPSTPEEGMKAVDDVFAGVYGESDLVNFQVRHSGPEVSAMVIVGERDEFTILPLSQDHKRLGDGDTGPNTGGMGAYAPVPKSIVNAEQYGQIEAIAAESLDGIRADGFKYEKAVLYIGLMMSEQQAGRPVVIEYNCRFGDPETQVLMPLMLAAGVDMYRLLRSAAEGDLEIPDIDMADLSLAALTICLASAGYPEGKRVGDQIWGLQNDYDDVTVQQAAVKDSATNGGRVLYVTATGETIDDAAASAYAAIDVDRQGPDSGKIGFDGMQFRRDIGHWARTAV